MQADARARAFFSALFLSATASTLLLACSGGTPQETSAADRSVVLTTVVEAAPRVFSTRFRAIAEVVSRDGVVMVPAEVSGRLTELLVDTGDMVTSGQPMARLDPSEQNVVREEALAEVRRLGVLLADARATAAETRQLARSDFVSRNELRKAERDAETTQQQLEAALARAQIVDMDLGRLLLIAPTHGTVSARNIAGIGSYVRAGDIIFELVRTGSLEFAIDLPESALKHDLNGAQVRILEGGVTHLSRVQPRVSGAARTVRTYAPATGGNWVIGRAVEVEIQASPLEYVAVPEEAIALDGDGKAVFAVVQGKARRIPVERITGYGGWAAVTGLNAGTRIAVSGVAFLRDGTAVREGSE